MWDINAWGIRQREKEAPEQGHGVQQELNRHEKKKARFFLEIRVKRGGCVLIRGGTRLGRERNREQKQGDRFLSQPRETLSSLALCGTSDPLLWILLIQGGPRQLTPPSFSTTYMFPRPLEAHLGSDVLIGGRADEREADEEHILETEQGRDLKREARESCVPTSSALPTYAPAPAPAV